MPKSSKTLVFLDIDGTLLKPNYKVNSRLVPKYIKQLGKQGYLFCLNSNRSRHDIMYIAKMFGINGPIIGENGIFYIYKGQLNMLAQVPMIQGKLLKVLGGASANSKVFIDMADTVNYPWQNLKNTALAWIVNSYRHWTASIHVVKYGQRNVAAARNLAKQLQQFYGHGYRVEVSAIFANVLVTPKKVDKGRAIKQLKKYLFPKSRLIMIGDDSADLSAKQVVDEFYAVGNAESNLKNNATYVAKKTYTQGVVEILKLLLQKSNT